MSAIVANCGLRSLSERILSIFLHLQSTVRTSEDDLKSHPDCLSKLSKIGTGNYHG
jgi:hypothetical protein